MKDVLDPVQTSARITDVYRRYLRSLMPVRQPQIEAALAEAIATTPLLTKGPLLEAVPPDVSARVVEQTTLPVIGCGAGPACHGHVIVTHDGIGLSQRRPRFAPMLADLSEPMKQAFAHYVQNVAGGQYPAPEHQYEMPIEEKEKFLKKK